MHAWQWLVAKGVTMKTTNHVGHTCMHKAAQLGHLAFVKYLVEELKIDVRHVEPDGEGNSPADLAREAKHDDLAAWLDSQANRRPRAPAAVRAAMTERALSLSAAQSKAGPLSPTP